MHIYSLRSINSLQAMEMHGNFHPHIPQNVAGEGIQFPWIGVLFGSKKSKLG